LPERKEKKLRGGENAAFVNYETGENTSRKLFLTKGRGGSRGHTKKSLKRDAGEIRLKGKIWTSANVGEKTRYKARDKPGKKND